MYDREQGLVDITNKDAKGFLEGRVSEPIRPLCLFDRPGPPCIAGSPRSS